MSYLTTIFGPAFGPLGALAGGAKLFFYLTGTSTLSVVYADADLTTPLPNPVEADVVGRFPDIFMDDDITYRIRMETMAGELIDEVDPFVPGGGGGGGGTGGDFIQSGTGAVIRTFLAKTREVQFSVADFGATGTDNPDDAAYIQAAYDALVALGGGTLWFPKGTWRCELSLTSRNVHLKGVGRGASIIKPVTATGTAITAIYREGSWDGVQIRDLDFRSAGTLQGVGFAMGADPAVYTVGDTLGDEFDGVNYFYNCRFSGFDKCIQRRVGDIGLWIYDCQFETANYHLWCKSNTPPPGVAMHAGCTYWQGGHRQDAKKASFYMDGPLYGSGQITFQNTITESNPGFAYFIKDAGDEAAIPTICIKSDWNETNATAGTVNIDSTDYAVAWGYFRNTSSLKIEDTPLGNITLVNSNVTLKDCPIDNLATITQDKYSCVLPMDGVKGFASGVGFPCNLVPGIVRTFTDPTQKADGGTAYTYKVMPRGIVSRAFNGTVLQCTDCATEQWWVGSDPIPYQTIPVDNDAALPGLTACQRIELAAGDSLFPQIIVNPPGDPFDPAHSGSWAVPAQRWVVSTYIYKHVSGPVSNISVTGTSGLSSMRPMSETDWTTMMTLSIYLETGATADAITAVNPGGSTSIFLCGGCAAVAFATREAALLYMNSGIFPTPNPLGE